MHIIKLKVHDSLYDHIMYVLKNLNNKEIEIIEESKPKKKNDDIVIQTAGLLKSSDINLIKWQEKLRDEWDDRD